MQRLRPNTIKYFCLFIISVMFLFGCGPKRPNSGSLSPVSVTDPMTLVGVRAAGEALSMLSISQEAVEPGHFIVASNAGYVEINEKSTFGAQYGLVEKTRARRGYMEVLEVHSAPIAPLWFAVCQKSTGKCVYLEVASNADPSGLSVSDMPVEALFSKRSLEIIKAEYLYEHAEAFNENIIAKPFGGNEFRIITMINAVLAGAPTNVVKSFEFHDHYCPGVTSGILMANYVKTNFPIAPGGAYFVQSVQPWCKEDALLVMLNTTPGKGGYAVSYPTDEDKARWLPEAKDAATIFYRKNPATGAWDGIILGFGWDRKTDCPDFGKSMLGKLCSDLFFLKHLQTPEKFVKTVHTFVLPKGVEPKEYARPGINPMAAIGLLSQESIPDE